MSRKTLNTLAQIHQEQKAKSTRKKVVDQTTRINLTPEAQEFRAIMRNVSSPIEQVVFIESNTPHDGNRYFLEYPPTWRTISNQKLSIGVRSITFVNKEIDFGLSFYGRIYDWNQKKEIDYKEVLSKEYAIFDDPSELKKNGFDELKDNLNEDIDTFVDEVNVFCGTETVDKGYEWELEFSDEMETIVLRLLPPGYNLIDGTCELDYFGIIINETNFELSDDVKNMYQAVKYNVYYDTRDENIEKYTQLPEIIIPYSAVDYHRKLLLSASFVGQTQRNYLGFTDVVFNPPKIYPLSSSDNGYYIELFNKDGKTPVELPNHQRQLIVIETQLIQESPVKYNF